MITPVTVSIEERTQRTLMKLADAWKVNRSRAYRRVIRAGLEKMTEQRREKKG